MTKYHYTKQPVKRDLITLPLFFILVIIAMFIAMRGDENYRCDIDRVIVQEGDTLSGLAVKWCHGNTLKATDDLVAKYGQVIQVSQEVRFGK
jgi:hypothetical protein